MMAVSMFAIGSALAPAARKQRVETSEGRNPKDEAPIHFTVSRKVWYIRAGVTPTDAPSWKQRDNRVLIGGPLSRRYIILLTRQIIGHKVRSPDLPRPITLPRTLFFDL